jgi:hypothetical protein
LLKPPAIAADQPPPQQPHPAPLDFLPKPHHYRLARSFGMDQQWLDDFFARNIAWARCEGRLLSDWDQWFSFTIRDVFFDVQAAREKAAAKQAQEGFKEA